MMPLRLLFFRAKGINDELQLISKSVVIALKFLKPVLTYISRDIVYAFKIYDRYGDANGIRPALC